MPGVAVSSFWVAFVAAVVFGVVNALIKPLVVILTLPINLITLGLFTLVINALLALLVAFVVPGFTIAGFWVALIFGIILTLINWAVERAF